MWNKSEEPKPPSSHDQVSPPSSPEAVRTVAGMSAEVVQPSGGVITSSLLIKGEIQGREDLYIDGEVEGNIDLHNHNLVIGPNGRVRANVFAKDVVIHGKVDGSVTGENKVELKKSALLNGDILTQRIVIEDGAFFKGSIDIRKVEPAKVQSAVASAPVAAAPAVAAVAVEREK